MSVHRFEPPRYGLGDRNLFSPLMWPLELYFNILSLSASLLLITHRYCAQVSWVANCFSCAAMIQAYTMSNFRLPIGLRDLHNLPPLLQQHQIKNDRDICKDGMDTTTNDAVAGERETW